MKSTSKIGVRRNVVNRHEKTFKRGSLMFIEGEDSREMYIIRSGMVRILKQEGENTIELAVLGPGSVLGELSLLDHQPRSATAQVIETVTATIIDEALLEQTMQKAPSWLSNIVQVIVKRLRDTMKRTGEDIVRKNVAGVIRVILLLNATEGIDQENERLISITRAKELVFTIIGLGSLETENVFMHLILKDMVLIRKNNIGQEFLVLKDPAILQMYMNYLRAKQRDAMIFGEKLSDQAVELLEVILATGEKNGKKVKENIVQVSIAQIELEHDRQGLGQHINSDTLDELIEGKVIAEQQKVTESSYGHHKRALVIYNTDTLRRVIRLKQWLGVFAEEIQL